MLEFRPIALSDKAWADELLAFSDFRGCEYSFGNSYCWQDIFENRLCRYKDFYLLRNKNGFFFPAGRGDLAEVLRELRNYCKENALPFFFSSMNKLSMLTLKEFYGANAEVGTNPDWYDYIYDCRELTELSGKKYHAKRNHIARFSEKNWSYEEITPENIGECREMNEEWQRRNVCEECPGEKDKSDEVCAVRKGLDHFWELGYVGGLLRVDGAVQAFTFGEKVNSDTFAVHAEKAFTDYQGAYPMINKQFLLHSCRDYRYINREEDMGEANLRKAKQSYYPCFMEEKFSVRIV